MTDLETRVAECARLREQAAACRLPVAWQAFLDAAGDLFHDHGDAMLAAVRDGERYRWLRNGGIWSLPYDDHGIGPEFPCEDALDAIVDAAIQQEAGR
jgi:hypothetical protein